MINSSISTSSSSVNGATKRKSMAFVDSQINREGAKPIRITWRVKLLNGEYKITDITSKIYSRNPSGPFTTSTLQQSASSKLGFGASRTM